ncbi:MAG: HU family DNA-binding protein [Clostridia bacterium]|nr:HU family DNA-binding protein [Clostridia bacterium]
MNKGELIKAIAEKTGLTIKEVDATMEAFIEVVTLALQKGAKVAINGFGTYELKQKAARTGINPQTKQPVKIAASKVPAFKISKVWKAKFN